MEFFRDTSFDFMGTRAVWLTLSLVAFTAALVVIFGLGHLNVGIDFAGGTQLTVRFKEEPALDELRALLDGAGISDALIQRFGEEGSREVILKTASLEGSDEGSQALILESFEARYNPDIGQSIDLNQQGAAAITGLLVAEDPDGVATTVGDPEIAAHYGEAAAAIMELRRDVGLIETWESIGERPEVSSAVLETLRERAALGNFAILAAETVGPQIGDELRTKGILAVVFSIVGMLVYIWLRFELRFGIGAVLALVHDVVICLGLYALAGYEFNLSTIAAFLTVVGYSVNDSVVVFDRVRENLRRTRREPLKDVLNRSLNQTLSRTVLTSGTTLLAVGTLFAFGGDVIRGFAFVLMLGVVIGTYSTLFVASPVVLFWERFFGREARQRRAAVA